MGLVIDGRIRNKGIRVGLSCHGVKLQWGYVRVGLCYSGGYVT